MRAPYDRKTGEFISMPLIMSGCIARPADADELPADDVMSYDELKGDLLTLGWDNHQMYSIEEVDLNGDVFAVNGVEFDDERLDREEDDVDLEYFEYGSCPEDWALIRRLARMKDHYNFAGELIQDEDIIRISQQSTRGGLPNIGRRNLSDYLSLRNARRGPRAQRYNRGDYELRHPGSQRSANPFRNYESHCPKYGRQDYRHQQPRLEAKYDRRFARDEAHMEEFFSRISDYPAIEIEYDFLSVSDQMRIPDWKICGDHEVTQDDLGEDDHREEFTADDVRLGRSIVPLSWYPSYSSARDDLRSGRGDFDHSFDDWMEELFDRFKGVGDRDDIFEGYGDADRDLDTATFSDSSRLRGTRKYNLRALTALHAVVA